MNGHFARKMQGQSSGADNEHMNKPEDIKPRFGWLLLACAFAVLVCGVTVWVASTYLTDCCGP